MIQGKDVVAEYAVSAELGEACTCLGEIDSGLRWAAVSEAVSDSLERKAAHRKALGEFDKSTVLVDVSNHWFAGRSC